MGHRFYRNDGKLFQWRLLVLTLLFATMWTMGARAQTTVTIGTGTSTVSTVPIYGLYGYSYSQILYTATDITGGGWAGGAATITNIRFYLNTAPATPANDNSWTVYLGNTSLTSLTAGAANYVPTSAMTQCFSGTVTFPAGGNWMDITLSTPFSYSGGNLLIAVDENAAGYSSASWRYTAATGMSRYLYSDTYNPDPTALPGSYSGTSSSTANRPNLQMVMVAAPACSGTPNGGTATAGTYNFCGSGSTLLSVSGSTSGVTGLSYQWQSGPSATGPWTSISGATNATYTTPTLTTTTYYQRLISCTNSGLSNVSDTTVVNINTVPTVSVTPTSYSSCTSPVATSLSASGASTYSWSPAAGLNATTGASVNASVTSSTVYTVTGTSTEGCTGTATASVNLNYSPAAPTTTNYSICLNGTVPSGQGLSVPAPPSSGTVTAVFTGSPFTSPGPVTSVSTVSVPGLPAGATITSATLQLFTVSAVGASYMSEIRVALTGAYTLAATQVSTTGSSGTISPDPVVNLTGWPAAGGSVTLVLSESYDDGGTDATIAGAQIVINYSVPTTTVSWWDAASGGTQVGSGPVFDPVAALLVNPSVSGNTTFYAQYDAPSCSSARVAAVFSVGAALTISAITPNPTAICQGQNGTLAVSVLSGSAPFTYNWEDGVTGTISTAASPTISPTTTLTYTVTVTDNCGQIASSTVTVPVNPIPSVTASGSAAASCGGSTVVLTASGTATSYSWAPSTGLNATTGASVNATPTTSTTYTVTGTLGGCTATYTVSVGAGTAVTVNSVTADPSSVCVGGSTQLNATGQYASGLGPVNTYTYAGSTSGATLYDLSALPPILTTSNDDTPSGILTLPFAVTFDGVSYTECSVSPDGWVLFGNTAASNQFTNLVTSTTNIPKLYPYWDDLATGTTGYVKGAVAGTAPNRVLIVQWFVTIPRNTTGAANSTFEARIYETTGVVEFHYGAMGPSSTMSASVGMTGNATNFHSVTLSSLTSSTVTSNDGNTDVPTAGTMITYTPVQQYASISSFSWSPASGLNNTAIANPTAGPLSSASTYTVTATSPAGCTGTASITINVGDPLVLGGISGTSTICQGASTSLTATITSGSGPFTYSWSDGSNPVGTTNPISLSPSATTIFTVTVTDGCLGTATATYTVNVDPAPSISVSPTSSTYCSSAVALTASGGTSYAWSPSTGLNATTGVSVNASPLITTTYTVTGTGSNGCTATATAVVNKGTPITNVVASASPQSFCAPGGNSTLNVTATVNSTPPAAPTTYCGPTVQSGVACVSLVTIGTLNNSGSACVTPYYNTYAPTGANTTTLIPGTTYPITVTCAATAIVSVWIDFNRDGVYDASEWVQPYTTGTTGTVNITVPLGASLGQTGMRVRSRSSGNPNGSTDACSDFGSGSCENYTVTIGSFTPTTLSYSWSPAAGLNDPSLQSPTASSIAGTTTYTVTISETNGCTATGTTTIDVGSALTLNPITGTATICQGQSTSLTASVATGNAPYTYDWSDAGGTVGTGNPISLSPSASSVFTVTVTDACGQTATATYSVTVNSAPSVSASPSSSSYCGTAVALSASGAVTYSWAPGAGLNATTGSSVNASPVASTTYTVTGTGSNGCTATATASVTVGTIFTSVTASASPSNICTGQTANLTVNATLPPCANFYNVNSTTYGLQPTAGFTALAGADDADLATGISLPFSFNFYGTAQTSINISSNGYAYFGAANGGSIFADGVTNGISVFSADMFPTAGQVSYGTVGVAPNRIFVIDWNGMPEYAGGGTHTGQLQIFESGLIQIHVASATSSTRNKTLGLRNTAGTDNTYPAGFANLPWTVNTPTAWTFSPCISATITAYSWSPGAELDDASLQSPVYSPTANGVTTFTVTVTNSGGCTATATTSVTVGSTINVSASAAPATICSGISTTLTATPTGGCGAYTYDWSDGVTSIGTTASLSVSPSASSVYTVVVTDNQSNSSSATVPVTVVASPTVSISPASTILCTSAPVSLTASGASSYSWIGTTITGSTTVNFDVAAQPAETNAAPGNVVATATLPALPAGATITGATLTYNNLTALGSSWMSDIRLGFSGSVVSAEVAGTGSASTAGTFNYTSSFVPTVTLAGGSVNLLYWDFFSDNAGAEATFPTGTAVATLVINYTLPANTASVTVTPTATTTYTVIGTDGVTGCTSSATSTITIVPPFTPTASASPGAVCSGGGSALSVSVSPSGTYTYSWTPAAGLNDPSSANPVASGITSTTVYTVTATYTGSTCSATATTSVSVTPLSSVTVSATPDVICAGQSSSLSSFVIGGGAPYQFDWSAGSGTISTSASLTVTPAGTTSYTLTVTDACGSTLTATPVTVTVNPSPTTLANPTSALYCGTAISVTASGAATYAWSPTAGLNNSTSATVLASPTATTTYTVTGTTAGCSSTATVVITVGTPITVDATADTTQSCSPMGTVLHACVNPSFTTYTLDSSNVDYSGTAASIQVGGNDDTETILAMPFTFNFFGTNYSQVMVSTNGYISFNTSNTSLSVGSIPTAGTPDAFVALTGCDLHTQTAGTIDTFTVGSAPSRKFVVRYNDLRFFSDATTSVVNGKIILHEGTGIIEVRVDNVNSGTDTRTRTLGIENAGGTAGLAAPDKNNTQWNQTSPVTYRFSPAARTCNNAGITFTWSPATSLSSTASADPTVTGLSGTTIYTVTAQNASGCTAQDTVTLIVFPQAATPTITPSGPLSFCPGGSVTLTSSNNTFPNLWSTSETTNSITVSTTQNISLIAYDAFCPSAPASVNVERYDTIQPLINVDGGGVALCGSSTRTLTADGGPQFVAWTWSTTETTQAITIGSIGTYGVSAQDFHGCYTYNSVTFVAGQTPVAPVISTTSPLTVCNNDAVTMTSDLADGLTWSPTFDNTQSITYNLSPPGTYDFFVTRDSLGCTSESNHLNFTVNPSPDVTSFSPADSACVGDVITLSGSGFTNVSSISFNGTPATTFTVVDDFTITVTVPAGATSGGITLTDGTTGCAGVSPLFTIKVVCGSTLNMTAFIQGYYVSGSLNAPLFNNGISPNATDCDTIKVCLMDAGTYAEVECATGILQTDGTVSLSFTSSGSFYLKVTHQNTLETWSAAPVSISGTSSYDFTTDNAQSYGPNMVEVATGVWALFNGDVNGDGLIEAADYSDIENAVVNFDLGYLPTDLTGDGLVEAADYSLIENNVPLFIFTQHP